MGSKRTSNDWTTIDIGLGYYEELSGIFNLGDEYMRLEDAITFELSQTLQRDMYFGSWAQAYRNGDGQYRVKITSPHDDVRAYERLIPAYIQSGQQALSSFYEKVPASARRGWKFLLPFGLAMANVKSIQLLHFPPLETFTYRDYLYSPTNRRWECLLAQNGFDGAQNTPLERIVDVEPIAAPGGAGAELADYNQDFIAYAKAQLENFLQPQKQASGKFTQPIVAYGGPVHEWLFQAFGKEQPDAFPDGKAPRTLDVLKLKIIGAEEGSEAPETWVLCANHPSQYLYDTSIPLSQADKPNGEYAPPIVVMCQDLVAAGWQAHMSESPGEDARAALKEMEDRWGWDASIGKFGGVTPDKKAAVEECMKEQNAAFSLDNDSFEPTEAQKNASHFFVARSRKSSRYQVYAFEPESKDPFSPVKMDEHASYAPSHNLMQVGGYLIDWTPAPRGSGEKDPEIHYRLVEFDRNSGNPLSERTQSYGYWKKQKFFGNYRPNFGASFSDIELLALPGYVLSIIPGEGRRTYQLWNFDPQSEEDCLFSGDFTTGGFRDIQADRELYAIGNYVLDRKGSSYRVWSFDPQSTPPLALPAVQEGVWKDIGDDDALGVVGEYVVTWKPDDPAAGCRIWKFDPSRENPLGRAPISTCKVPEGFDPETFVCGVLPQAPQHEDKEKIPGTIEFMRKEIEHVVYYMVESRSFDNVLGWLHEHGQKGGLHWIGGDDGGFQGLDPSMKNRLPNGAEAPVTKYEDGKLSNAFVLGGPAQDPFHDNSDGLMQMFHGYEGYAKRGQPTMDGFAWNQNDPAVMSSFTPEQLTVLNGLARHFGVSDRWFSSLPGGTDVNRGFSVSGSAYDRLGTWEGGKSYQDWPDVPHRQSVWKVLWSNGQKDWKIYYNILWLEAVFTYQLYLAGLIPEVDAAWAQAVASAREGELPSSQWIAPYEQFERDVKYGTLPRFSYIEPAWVGADCTSYHPGSSAAGLVSMVPGEKGLNRIYETLRSSKLWEKTLLVVTFDKSGGLYDHVSPPYAKKPWPHDIADGFEFDLMGPRVPAVFASPWIQPGTVLRPPGGEGFDSTSFLATLLDWYGIPRGTWGLGDRVTSAPTIEKVLSAQQPRKHSPQLPNPWDKDFPKQS